MLSLFPNTQVSNEMFVLIGNQLNICFLQRVYNQASNKQTTKHLSLIISKGLQTSNALEVTRKDRRYPIRSYTFPFADLCVLLWCTSASLSFLSLPSFVIYL